MKKLLRIVIIILVALVVIAGLLWFLYYASFQSNLWQKFPEPLRTQMAMTHLEITDMENLLCHEDCMYEKQSYRQIIADYLAKNGPDSIIAGGVETTFSDEQADIRMRQDLVRVLKMAEDLKKKNDPDYAIKAPQYLIDYLSAPAGNPNLKDLIVAEFSADPSLAEGAVSALIAKIGNTSLGLDERIPAIKNLASLISKDVPGTEKSTTTGPIPLLKDVIDYPAICDLFMTVAEEKGDIRLRYAAINNFHCSNHKDYYSADFFNRLQNLLFNEDNHPEIQDNLVKTLYQYKIVDRDKTIEAIKKAYNDKNLSKFTIYTAAHILNTEKIAGYPEPQITDEEWRNSADTMDEVRYYGNKPY